MEQGADRSECHFLYVIKNKQKEGQVRPRPSAQPNRIYQAREDTFRYIYFSSSYLNPKPWNYDSYFRNGSSNSRLDFGIQASEYSQWLFSYLSLATEKVHIQSGLAD